MKKLLPGNLFKRKKDKLGWEIISEKSYTSLIEQYQLYIKNPEENDIPKEWYPYRYNSTEGFPIIDYSNFDFSGWDFSGVSFHNCKLNGARFHNAILVGTDLHQAKGLRSDQLAGADVTNAELPEEINKFEGLEVIQEASKNARKLFLAMLLGCVYAIITIATTTDARLIANSASSPLPIIGAEIPIAGFYWAAPLLLVSLYLYFHIYMQRLWERLAELPAVFPEGVPLDEKAYPWLMFGLVRKHFARLRDERPPLSRIQVLLSSLLAWWAVPGALLMFWLRFLPRHDWPGTGLHVILLGFAVGFGIISHWLSAETLKGTNNKCRKPTWKKGIAQGTIASGFFLLVSIGAINGTPKTFIPRALEKVAFGAFADLEDAEVSTRPPNWTGLEEREKEEVALVKGAKLNNSNLRYANAKGAFLVKADFSDADLEGADLRQADLRYAILDSTHLYHANLSQSLLVGAKGTRARLDSANLFSADLRSANLGNASLVGAYLRLARLDSANLRYANLAGAILWHASLIGADFWSAHLDSAEFEFANLRGANLSRANLVGADLRFARLNSANFYYTNLHGANLTYVNLDMADLRRAGLRHLRYWRDIGRINLANIWGVFDPPDGFLAWADSMGAVSTETNEEWIKLIRQQGKPVPGHLLW